MIPAASPPFPATAQFSDGRLMRIGGCDVDDLAAEHGTPLWIIDGADLRARLRAYREAFDGHDVYYATKANSVLGVLRLALDAGCNLDVASLGELAAARAAGADGERLILHGNNKSDAELDAAIAAGVHRIVVDDHDEVARLDERGVARGKPIDVWVRATPGVSAGYHAAVRTGTDDQKFGLSIRAGMADAAIDAVVGATGVRLRGLHCHVGSGVLDPTAFEPVVDAMVGLMAGVRDRHGIELGELDLGGGLGIAETGGHEPSVASYAEALRSAVEARCAEHGLPMPRLAVEPGRSLVGPSGITLYQVGSVKTVPGVRTFIAVDGGMSDNPRHALYGAAHPFLLAGPAAVAAPGDEPVTVVGKHCESGDVLARDVVLGATPRPGGLMASGAAGAYTHAMASTYNRLPRPAMVLAEDGDARLLVRRESIDDLLALDIPPS